MSQVTLHGEPIIVGDKVWSLSHGWEEVVSINANYPCPIETKNGTYNKEGKFYIDNINPSIFWDEIKITIPPKPQPKFKKGDKVMASQQGDHFLKQYYSHYKDGIHFCFKDGGDEWSSDGDFTQWNIVRYPTEEELKC